MMDVVDLADEINLTCERPRPYPYQASTQAMTNHLTPPWSHYCVMAVPRTLNIGRHVRVGMIVALDV